MSYVLMWKGEEIDTAKDLQEAEYLRGEYNMAYGGGVTIEELEAFGTNNG